jgi:hypothetical protein
MIRVQLHMIKSWDVTTLLLNGNLILRLRAHMGLQKRLHRCITVEVGNLDNWSGGNTRSPMWPLSQNDGSLNLVEENRTSSHNPVLLTQKLH